MRRALPCSLWLLVCISSLICGDELVDEVDLPLGCHLRCDRCVEYAVVTRADTLLDLEEAFIHSFLRWLVAHLSMLTAEEAITSHPLKESVLPDVHPVLSEDLGKLAD